MKITFSLFALSFALGLGLVVPWVAQGQANTNVPDPTLTVPHIAFHDVPITIAIENLAPLAELNNYIIDPKLFVAADGTKKPEPILNLYWQNYAAVTALARVLKENHLVMVTNAFTTVVCITSTNAVPNPIDAKLLGDDTNGVIPRIVYDDVPLNIALTTLISQGHVNAVLDPQVSGEASPAPPDFKMTMMPDVSVRWHNLTARQAIVEICEVYRLVIVKGSSPNSVVIKYKK